MAAGGIDVASAGLLDPGSGNTFDPSTSVTFGQPGYWNFTVADYEYVAVNCDLTTFVGAPVTVAFFIYKGATGPDTFVEASVSGANARFQATPRETYWVVARAANISDIDDIALIVVTRSLDATPRVVTDWSTQLQDLDNALIISASGDYDGELTELNVPEFNTRVVETPDWFNRVIERDGATLDEPDEFGSYLHVGPPSRQGSYQAQEVLGGDDPIDALTCVWDNHIVFGDRDSQYWNSDPDSIDHSGDPICRVLLIGTPPSPATPEHHPTSPDYSFDYLPGGPLVSAILRGDERKVARGAWFLPVRDNLPPQGALGSDVLSLIDLDAAGIPPDYIGPVYIEFLGQYADLVSIDAAADRQDRSDTDALDTNFHLNLDLGILPNYVSGKWIDHWSLGVLGAESITTGRQARFTSDGSGTVAWNPLTGFTGWDDCSAWPADDPDVIVGMELAMGTPAVDTSAQGHADLAFRLTLLAQPFRLVYFPETFPVTRQEPRSPDALGLSTGTRIFPAPTAGRIFGGDQ